MVSVDFYDLLPIQSSVLPTWTSVALIFVNGLQLGTASITVLSVEVTRMMMRGFRMNTLTYNAFANSFLVIPCLQALLNWLFLKMGDAQSI